MTIEETKTAYQFVLCRSDTGDGGWSLHPPGSTDEEIASGEAMSLLGGPSIMENGRWNRPDANDFAAAKSAFRLYQLNKGEEQ
jgi:hypothetical protein